MVGREPQSLAPAGAARPELADVAIGREAASSKDKPRRPGRRFLARFTDPPVQFELTLRDGTALRFGPADRPPAFRAAIRSEAGMRALVSLNEFRFAEAYINCDIDIAGDMEQLFRLRPLLKDLHPMRNLWRFVEPLLFGQVRANRRAIAVHYERDAGFFFQFLDAEVPLYTQGLFASDDDTLKDSALRKFDYCWQALRLKPGDRVLEIGPGWGGWLNYASARGARCTGISISHSSLDYLAAEATRLGHAWELVFADVLEYTPGRRFDAIVMMGIIEHLPQYDRVLERFARMIQPGGRVFLDGSSASRKYDLSATTLKYIFPGNHSPLVLHDFLAKLSRTGFALGELFDDRHSYYLTLRNWALNWERNRAHVVQRYGEHDFRRFQLYFWGTAAQFLARDFGCFRMILEAPAERVPAGAGA